MMKTRQVGDKESLFHFWGRYLQKVATGLVSLLSGMGVTIRYFVCPDKIITQQYPENRENLQMMARFRGHLAMIHDENNQHRCTGCGICEKACPNGTISVLTAKDLAGRKVLGRYIYRLSQCTLCNLCIESCPFGAISMGRDFELATYDRQQLTFILNKTQGGK
ncbi:MAG: NADH-quinone oxidoreductase subunit I [Desulfobulbaceae bacterium]|nr:NADH-quinone oxidoreductase subunit I [Desulfobulbaceae bacterium]